MPHPHEPERAIIHVDGDAFFASCEQALHPEYKGKPVITGLERGIVSAASYEAKRLGIKRGVALHDVKKICPDAIIVPSDYESYSLFSKRMFDIIRRYTAEVEEYGIDEAFADLTGLRRPLHKSYAKIAQDIKQAIESELGITVSIGLAPSKVLAKIGSKWNKPSGFVHISARDITTFTSQLPTQNIWGIGYNTAQYLSKLNIHTALQFANKQQAWIEHYVTKPHYEIWHELNGRSVLPVYTADKTNYQSISKTKTFTPASSEKAYVFAQLSKNIENAFIKARRYQLGAKEISIFLKSQDFRYAGLTARLSRYTAWPHDVMPAVKKLFAEIFNPKVRYRASGIVLHGLNTVQEIQMNLFESPAVIEHHQRIYKSIDELSHKYGKHTVFLGSSLLAHSQPDQRQRHRQTHNTLQARSTVQVTGNSKARANLASRKYLGLPLLNVTVH